MVPATTDHCKIRYTADNSSNTLETMDLDDITSVQFIVILYNVSMLLEKSIYSINLPPYHEPTYESFIYQEKCDHICYAYYDGLIIST